MGIPNQHLYTNAIQPYARAPHLYLGFPTRYLPNDGQRVEPTLMVSRDGLNFHRWLEPIVRRVPRGSRWKPKQLLGVGLGGTPGQANHLSVYATGLLRRAGRPVASIRIPQGRFVSVNGGKRGGVLITKPIQLGRLADRLTLNYRTAEGGLVGVGLYRQTGMRFQDSLWQNAGLLRRSTQRSRDVEKRSRQCRRENQRGHKSTSKSHPVLQLRIELKNADLFSIQFQPWLR